MYPPVADDMVCGVKFYDGSGRVFSYLDADCMFSEVLSYAITLYLQLADAKVHYLIWCIEGSLT